MSDFGKQEIFPQLWEDMTSDELQEQHTKVLDRLNIAINHHQDQLIPLFHHYNTMINNIKRTKGFD